MYEKQLKKLRHSIHLSAKNIRIKSEILKKLEIKKIIHEHKGKTYNIVKYSIELPNSTVDHAYNSEFITPDLEFSDDDGNDIIPIEQPDYVIIYLTRVCPENDEEMNYEIKAISFEEYQKIKKN